MEWLADNDAGTLSNRLIRCLHIHAHSHTHSHTHILIVYNIFCYCDVVI